MCHFIDEFVALVFIIDQVHNFTDPVPVIGPESGVIGDLVFKVMVTISIHIIGPCQVQVPRVDLKLSGFRVVVIKVILSVGNIIMMNSFNDRAVTKVFFNVQIFSPPVCAWVPVPVSADER